MSAIISPCGQYRYKLTRVGHDAFCTRGPALFIMLNPSTADASIDDPTVGRCRSFAKTWDCDGIVIVNLYAFRATNPQDLWLHHDPVGPHNDGYLQEAIREHETIVCAWGANAKHIRVLEVMKMFTSRNIPMCLGVTKSGAPRHPLYIPGNQVLLPL